MVLFTEEDRENLLIEYKHLHDENWRRGQNVWLVNSILITGSLIAAFQPTIQNFPTPIVSLILVIIALILNLTTDKVTLICYERMNEIGCKMGIDGPRKMYESKIEGKWWFAVRRNSSYSLFIILIGVYSFLIFHNCFLFSIVLAVGFLAILLREVYSYMKREIVRSAQKSKSA